MEYFPDAENLSDKNITFALSENAMRGICSIHECYVVHNDIAERNCLVVSDNRVVWVDFDISFTPVPGRVPKRAYYWLEVDAVWELLYRREVSFYNPFIIVVMLSTVSQDTNKAAVTSSS